jgi:phospholipase/lecithinase/hemolysin
VPNVNTQVATFLAGHSLNAKQLVVLDGGANDFFDGKTDPNTPVDNLAAAITSLAAAGGKQFLVQNIPQLGMVPGSQSLPQAQRDALNALSLSYDSLLHTRLAQLKSSLGVTVNEVDLDALLNTIRANPGAYGFTNTTTSALAGLAFSGAAAAWRRRPADQAPSVALFASGAAVVLIAAVRRTLRDRLGHRPCV